MNSYKKNLSSKDNKSLDHFKENNDDDDHDDNKDHVYNENNEKSQTNEDTVDKNHQIYFPNDYNPSSGNFLPFIIPEMENMIKILKINSSLKWEISNDDGEDILRAVINCLLYHHYNKKDIQLLKNFFFEFSQNLFGNTLEKEELEYLWCEQTAFIKTIGSSISSEEKNGSSNKSPSIKEEYAQSTKDLNNDEKEIKKKKRKRKKDTATTTNNKSKQNKHTGSSLAIHKNFKSEIL